MHKKGQAAMEFLMTYGWAILVVLVAISALAYFGVLNPGQYLPSSCTVAPGIGCTDFKVDTSGNAQLMLRNGLGEDLSNVTVSLSVSGCTADTDADGDDTWNSGDILGGETTGVTLTGCTVGSSGSRFRSDLTVAYTSASGIAHSVAGELITKVE